MHVYAENAKLWLSKQNKNIYNWNYIRLCETFFGLNSVVFTEIKKKNTVYITKKVWI